MRNNRKVFIVYGSNDCIYCKKTMDTINNNGDIVEYRNISRDNKARQYIVNDLGAKTIPQIFIRNFDGTEIKIGGFEDLELYYSFEDVFKNQNQ